MIIRVIVESNRWNTWLITSCREHTMKMCRQGSGNLPSSANLPYQSGTHFNTPTCSKYSSKKQVKKHTPPPPPPPSANLPYQSETHFNTPTCSKYSSKKQMKKHTPLPPPPLLTPLIRNEYRITRMKRRRIKTTISSKMRISVHNHHTKFHFSSKNGILKIKFDSHQVHIKNQAIENRRIYMKIMFRLEKMLRDACDYCKTLWDHFKQLINYDNNISRCARGHCLNTNASKEKTLR